MMSFNLSRSREKEVDPGPIDHFVLQLRMALLRGRLMRIPYWPRERIEGERDRHLRKIVRFAYRTVPFYRREMSARGLSPDDIDTLERMSLLPIVGDDEMRSDPHQFVSSDHPPRDCYRFLTGGSTGVRKAIYHEPVSYFWNLAFGRRDQQAIHNLLGVGPGWARRPVSIMPGLSNLGRMEAIRRRNAIHPFKHQTPREWIDPRAPLTQQVAEINALRPDMISSYARTASHIYLEADRLGMNLHRPRLLLLHSEGLPPEERRELETRTGVPVIMLYSAMEARKLGFECEQRHGYHLQEDICPVRIVDARGIDVPSGQPGRVVISNLLNRGSVLLNFDLGDIGWLDDSPCPCGRQLRRLHLSHTRSAQMLKIPGTGKAIHHSEFLPFFFGRGDGVKQCQIVVEGPDHWIIVLVTPEPDRVREWLPAAIERIRKELTGSTVHLGVELRDRGEIGDGGKMSQVIFRGPGTG